MSGVADATGQLPPVSTIPRATRSWRVTDRIGLALAWVLGIGFLAITTGIVAYMMVQGLRYITPELMFTSPAAGYSESETGGFLDPLLGTVIVAIMALGIAFPIGLGVAVWLSEYGRPTALARTTESTVEMLAGSPSIVFALFGVLLFEQGAVGFLSRTNDGVVLGRSFFAAAAMLSLIALPLVVANVREGLQAIPGHVREASYAVGKTRWATTVRILLPAARPSVVTGAMLGLGRIIGDTAIIVLLLGATLRFAPAGEIPLLSTLKGTGSTLTTFVYANAPTGEANQPTKAYAAGFVLLSMVLVVNFAVDVVARRARKWR